MLKNIVFFEEFGTTTRELGHSYPDRLQARILGLSCLIHALRYVEVWDDENGPVSVSAVVQYTVYSGLQAPVSTVLVPAESRRTQP